MSSNTPIKEFPFEFHRETIVDQIVNILERRIVSGDLVPGSKLGELMVSREFGVSRIPSREALQRLEDMNFVKKTHYGRIVNQFSVDEFRDIYELKNGVELCGVMLGITRATDDDLEQIQAIVDQMKEISKSNNYTKILPINYRFHDSLVACSKNKKIIETFSRLAKQIRWASSISFGIPHRPMQALKEHMAIYSAFKNKDQRKIGTNLNNHNNNNLERIIARIKPK